MSNPSIAEMEATLQHHRAEAKRLVPAIAKAKWERELAHPTSYIWINGVTSTLRFVEQKTVKAASEHEAGVVSIWRPIKPNEVFYQFGRDVPNMIVDVSEFGFGRNSLGGGWRSASDYCRCPQNVASLKN